MYRKAICNKLKKRFLFVRPPRWNQCTCLYKTLMIPQLNYALSSRLLRNRNGILNFSELFDGRTQASENSLSLHCCLTSSSDSDQGNCSPSPNENLEGASVPFPPLRLRCQNYRQRSLNPGLKLIWKNILLLDLFTNTPFCHARDWENNILEDFLNSSGLCFLEAPWRRIITNTMNSVNIAKKILCANELR